MNLKERMEAWRQKARRLNGGRSLHGNTRAAIDGEAVGYGMAVIGGLVAIAGLLGVLFVPVATFTILDAELTALVGVILLIVGVGIRSSSM